MSAQRLTGRLRLTPGGSTYVDPDQLEWQPSQFDKISMKVLYRNTSGFQSRTNEPGPIAAEQSQ